MCYQQHFDQIKKELMSIKSISSLIKLQCVIEDLEEEVLHMQSRIDDLKRQNNAKRSKCHRLQEKLNTIRKQTQTPE